jgi:hypothetical protein
MSSARKTAANRKNAKKSTGPTSVTGRNVVRKNALKHGLTAETLVVEGEDAEAFRQMADAHLAVFRPRNDVELEFARTFTLAAWRRQRCASTETGMVNQYIRVTQRAVEVTAQQDVLALGDRLFHDSQGYWQLFPDPSLKGSPMSQRTNETPGGPDLPARLVNELESTYEGCCWLLHEWNRLRVLNLPGNFFRPLDKFKAIRLLGKQPLDVLEDTTGDLLVIFLASHALHPACKSPFSELRCEVCDDQYPTVRKRLELMPVMDMPPGEDAARQTLDDLIARHTRRLEQLARKHKARADAQAAESTRRLAFDPGPAADKVRRYEDASIRRMTRACDDLAKLCRSGMLDEDARQEAEPPSPARGPEPRTARGLRDDIPDFARWKPPGGGEAGEWSAPAEQAGCDAPPPISETVVDGPRSWACGECPPERETANIKPGAWVDQSPSPADARPISETPADVVRSWLYRERPAECETANIEAGAAPQESGSPATAQPSNPTAGSPRSAVHAHSGPWIALLLAACWWWLVASGQGAALRGRPISSEPLAQNKATAICAGRAGSADRLTVAASAGNIRGEREQTGERPAARGEPAARNKATAIRSDSAEYSALAGPAKTRQSGNSARIILDPSSSPRAHPPAPRGRGSPEQLTANQRGTARQ